jgi:hypothetical protein
MRSSKKDATPQGSRAWREISTAELSETPWIFQRETLEFGLRPSGSLFLFKQIGPIELEKHQTRLWNSAQTPLRHRLRRDITNFCHLARTAQRVDNFVRFVFHTED